VVERSDVADDELAKKRIGKMIRCPLSKSARKIRRWKKKQMDGRRGEIEYGQKN
jgi:hypothetical protein